MALDPFKLRDAIKSQMASWASKFSGPFRPEHSDGVFLAWATAIVRHFTENVFSGQGPGLVPSAENSSGFLRSDGSWVEIATNDGSLQSGPPGPPGPQGPPGPPGPPGGGGSDIDVFTVTSDGLVPAPGTTSGKVLSDDGTWVSQGGVSDGDKGDIVVSGGGATWNIDSLAVTTGKIANGAVTYSKVQNVSTASRVLGRKTGGAGPVEEITASDVLNFIGSQRGSILYRGPGGWSALSPGISGQVLTLIPAGAEVDPSWQDASGGSNDAFVWFMVD